MVKFKIYLTLLLSLLTFGAEGASLTATQMAEKAAVKFRSAKSISAGFTMSGALGSGSGTFEASGKKFAFVMAHGSSVWYNGKNMWTYNPVTKETTLIKPTARELAESNPFSFIAGISATYTANYAKSSPAGCKVIVLRAKKKNAPFSKVLLTLDVRTYSPKKIEIHDASGKTIINVNRFRTGIAQSSAKFEYPKSKYPKVKIIDLR